MFSAALEDRVRHALGAKDGDPRQEAIRFAVAFALLVVRILPDEVAEDDREAMARSIAARSELSDDEVRVLLELCLAPEHRHEISDDEVRAFGARFGPAAEQALASGIEQELDLEGFAHRYGPAEALLLLDALFDVCAVDGEIDAEEIGRLQAAARRLEVDPMLVGLLFRKHDLRHATGDITYALTGKQHVVIGRIAPADVRLPDPQVAPRHASLTRDGQGWIVKDLGSGRPTLIGGVAVRQGRIAPGDEVRVGPYRIVLHASGDHLTVFGADAVSALSLRGLTRTIDGRDGTISLLDDVGFTVFSGEVIALVGPSGAGKTTLLNAVTGIAPPDEGAVMFDSKNFHSMLAADRSLVGIVPQEDVVHDELTVEEALSYAARLRYPSDVKAAGIQRAVDRVLSELDIERIRTQRIGSALKRGISGGQRKRVNLGQELLTRTTRVLFLDEPTSGLDPHTAQDIVRQVRQLADDGRIVFLVTHDVSPSVLSLVDHLCVLAPGGRLAWFGPPQEACTWFGVQSVDEIFARLPDETPETWRDRYRQGAAWRKYVGTREHLIGLGDTLPPDHEIQRTKRPIVTQFAALTKRYATVKVRDWMGTGVLLAQAPILAAAFIIVFPKPDAATIFVLVLSSLWFGASASVRELIAERPVWRREARVGLRLLPYMASKVAVLAFLVGLQCALLTNMLFYGLGMGAFGFSLPALCGVSIATGLVGMSLGLFVSSAFSSSEAAVGTLPVALIPQIAFGGILVKLKEMTVLAKLVTYGMVTRFGFEAALKTGEELYKPGGQGLGGRNIRVSAVLWDFGFEDVAGADDPGMPMMTIMGVLFAFFAVFLAGATWLTGRAAKGS